MKYSYLIFMMLVFANTNAQLYQIGHTTINFIDASRNNRSIATEIFYPADSVGDNVPITTSNSLQFPSLVFAHGFVMTWDAYINFKDVLVPNGYIIAFPKTEGSFSPSHLEFAKDLAFVINQMNLLGTQSSSIFNNRVSQMNAVMGHSMGGGASFLATNLNSNIKTLVNFAAAETTPSAIAAAATITIPSLIFAGINDCVTPPNTNQLPMYTNLLSSCKTYIGINGASHCQMANSNAFCSFGESTCSPGPTITRSIQHNKIFSYLLPWLDFQLKENCFQGSNFDSQIINDSSITYQKNCIQCDFLLNNEYTNLQDELVLYPNPSDDFITILGISKNDSTIKITDINSKVIYFQSIIDASRIDVSKLDSGVYFYEIVDLKTDKKSKGKFVKK